MKNIKLAVIFCSLLLIKSFTLHAQSSNETLTQQLKAAYNKGQIPGFAVAIVNKDSLLYQNAFGYADIATKKTYTQQTIHNIGSTSKTLIGIAIMQLVEQGKLTLDTKINEVLPFTVNNPYHPEIPITVRQLATHTSSINDRIFNYESKAYISEEATRAKRKKLPLMYRLHFRQMQKNKALSLGTYLESVLSKKGKWYRKKNFLKVAPGTKENYTNIGAALAAYVVEIMSGVPYDEFTSKNILQPLGMTSSGWTYSKLDQQQVASRYVKDQTIPKYSLITYPDGGLISSCADLSTYAMAMIKGYYGESELLTAASFQTLMGNQFEQTPLKTTIKNAEGRSGIFWDIFGKEGVGDIGHSGSDPGILSFFYFDPTTGIGCVLLTNVDSHKRHTAVVDIWQLLIAHRNGM